MDPILEIKDLKKYYPEVKAVNGISFKINPGTCFGLLGPNGAGKTTTIEMMEGILDPTGGEILFKGKRRTSHFREKVGIQLQNTELPQYLTVLETLETFRNLYTDKKDLDYLIEACHLKDILKQDNRKISGGQKQRLLLAMALVNDPEIVFLDEPTTGLDPQARRHLWEIVHQIKKENKTIILTTHYMEEAEILCDEIAIIDHGKVIAHGSTDDLLSEHCKGSSIILNDFDESIDLKDFPYKWYRLEGYVEIQTDDVNKCVEELVKNNIDLSGLCVRSQNLEDLFLKLTGSQLRS